MPEELPDKINERLLIVGEARFDMLDLIKKYNSLPIDDSQRKTIYEQIKSLANYEDWD